MGLGIHRVYQVTMTSAATLTPVVDLGRTWTKVYLDPTGAASEVRLQASVSATGTFLQVYHPSINSSTVGANIFKIPSSVSGGLIEIPNGLRYIKVETTSPISNGLTMKLICSD